MEQLKGKIGGVNRLGTTSDMTSASRPTPVRHRSGEIDEDHRHRRKPASVSPPLSRQHHAVHPSRRALGARSGKDGLQGFDRHRRAQNPLSRQRSGHAREDRQGTAPVRRQSRPRLHRSASFHQDQQGRDQSVDRQESQDQRPGRIGARLPGV